MSKMKILIGAPKSASGKTLVTCGLLNLLKKKNIDLISYKCGPDYIDPMFHRKVLGINGGNLDSFFQTEEMIKEAVTEAKAEAIVIEGVMGLYDGMELSSKKASAYDIARITDTPIVLLVDGKGAGRTLISIIKGLLLDDEYKLIKAIIINKMSKQYFDKLVSVMQNELSSSGFNVDIIGCIPVIKDINIDSRHLGLKMPNEIEDINKQIDIVSDKINECCDIDRLMQIMANAGELKTAKKEISKYSSFIEGYESQNNGNVNLAVAYDEAFCFYYKENFELLQKKAVNLVFFSPLHDEQLPDNIDGLLLGGGYPENYLKELSLNKAMLMSIKKWIEEDRPCLAECGGFIYLHDLVADTTGNEYSLVGAIAGKANYTDHLVRFGYASFEANKNLNDGKKLSDFVTSLKGHEFHYYDSSNNGNSLIASKPSKDKCWETSISTKNQLLGFPHFFYPSDEVFIDAFINRMKEAKANVERY